MFSMIFEGVKDVVSGWFNYKKSQLQTQRDVQANRSRLALSVETHNSDWEMSALANSDVWLKRISFAVNFYPIVKCNFNPEEVHHYFITLAHSVPGWWMALFVVINSAIWGVSPVRNFILAIIDAVKK